MCSNRKSDIDDEGVRPPTRRDARPDDDQDADVCKPDGGGGEFEEALDTAMKPPLRLGTRLDEEAGSGGELAGGTMTWGSPKRLYWQKTKLANERGTPVACLMVICKGEGNSHMQTDVL